MSTKTWWFLPTRRLVKLWTTRYPSPCSGFPLLFSCVYKHQGRKRNCLMNPRIPTLLCLFSWVSRAYTVSSKVFPRKESLLLRLKHFETACNPFLWHLRLNREATDFKHLFMVFMSTWQLCSIVTQVQILCIFREAVSWENLLHRWTSKRKIF